MLTPRHLGALSLCAFLTLSALSAADASAQVIAPLDSAPCANCAPTGWVIDSQTPDFISGNGAWPGGGGWQVSDVSGPSPAGGGMVMLVSTTAATYRESIRTTATGLAIGQRYQACFFYENSRVVNGAQDYTNGTFKITAGGVSMSFPEVSAWTRACVPFVATALTTTVTIAIDSSGIGTSGGMIVVDGGADAITLAAVCGDGVVAGAETCDDGNTTPGDGCGATCLIEPGYSCTGAPSRCALLCDNQSVTPATTVYQSGTDFLARNPNALFDKLFVTPAPIDERSTYKGAAGVDSITPRVGAVLRMSFTQPMALTHFLLWQNYNPDNEGLLSYGLTFRDAAGVAIGAEQIFMSDDCDCTEVPAERVALAPVRGVRTVDMRIISSENNSYAHIMEALFQGRPDCDDGNACTTDMCTLGVCSSAPAAAGTACMGGVCDGLAAPSCQTCLNNSIAGQDAGCTMAQPFCQINGMTRACVQCEADANCASGSICTTNACAAAQLAIATPINGSTQTDNTPTLSGTASAGRVVTLSVAPAGGGAPLFATPTTATGGMWSIDSTSLPDGSYTLTASISASGGPVTATSTFRIDTTAPMLAITAPADGAVTNDATPTISGTAADAGSGVSSVRVEILDAMGASVFLDATIIAADGSWTIDATTLPDGAYTVSATTLDAAGNPASAGPVAFTVDTMAPAIALLTPADDSVTNDATPTLSGTAEVGATVQVIVRDGTGMIVFTGAPAVAADGTWSVDASTLADGAYTVQASATDAAGNAASSAINAVLIDTMAPVVVISSPADGALTSERQPTFTGTSEPGSTVTVELLDAAGAVLETFTVTADNTGAWSVGPTASALDDGDYTVSASAIDAATNASAVTTAGFTVDATALPLTIDAPTAGAVVAMTPAISGTTAPGAEVSVTLVDAQGMTVETLTATADAQGAWSVTPAALVDGAYTVNAEVSSATGVISNASTMFSVDTMAPAVAIDTPAADAILTVTQPVISGSAEPGAALTITILDAQGMTVETLTTTADAQGAWSVTPAALADGAYTVNATASDAAGNTATAGPRAFSVDTSAPTVTITAPTAGQQIASTTPTITGTAEPGATVTILIDGMSVGTTTADASGMWSFVSPELALGSHTVEATTTDGTGNMGSSGTITFEVATMAAPVVITTPTTGGTVTGPNVTVTGTGEPGATITVTVGDKSQTVVVGDDGSWTVTFEGVPAGETTISAGDGASMASVIITVIDAMTPDDDSDLVFAGGCAQGAGGSPVSGGLWLLVMGAVAWRRKRRA